MLFIDGIIYSLQRFGGISTYTDQFVEWFSKHATLNTYGVNNYDGPVPQVNHARRPLDRIRPVKVGTDYDLFFSSYYRIPDRNVKMAITVYDFTHEKFFPKLNSVMNSVLKARALSTANKIICISENTRDDLYHFYGQKLRRDVEVEVIHLGYDSSTIIPKLKKYNEIKNILFLGSRAKYKNFDLLISGLALTCNNVNLHIVGGGALNKHEIAGLKNARNINYTFYGYLDNIALQKLYNIVDLLAYPSAYEGFGLPVLECMARGIPVMANKNSSLKEILGNYPICLPELTALNVRDFLRNTNSSAINEAVEYGLKRARNFTLNKCSNHHRQFLEN